MARGLFGPDLTPDNLLCGSAIAYLFEDEVSIPLPVLASERCWLESPMTMKRQNPFRLVLAT